MSLSRGVCAKSGGPQISTYNLYHIKAAGMVGLKSALSYFASLPADMPWLLYPTTEILMAV